MPSPAAPVWERHIDARPHDIRETSTRECILVQCRGLSRPESEPIRGGSWKADSACGRDPTLVGDRIQLFHPFALCRIGQMELDSVPRRRAPCGHWPRARRSARHESRATGAWFPVQLVPFDGAAEHYVCRRTAPALPRRLLRRHHRLQCARAHRGGRERHAWAASRGGPGTSALTTAVTLANTCASAYVRANEKTRRFFNNAVFEAVLVRDRKAAEARICDPCDLLFSSRRFEYGDLAGRSRHY